MRLLLIDNWGGDGMIDYALRCMEDGHQVKWFYRRTPKNMFMGKGLLDRVDDWRDWVRWADLVVLSDNTKYMVELNYWRAKGVKIVGGCPDSASWELSRTLGQKILEKAGIDVPPFKEFNDYDKAIAYVKSEGRRFVSKPCGDEENKALSYVSKSPADLVYMLQRWKKAKKHKGSFMLQEFVPGVEMAVGAWFGPGGFNRGWCENFEFKQLMAGDRGPNTGEMGTVLRYADRSKLADKVLRPLEDDLHRIGYCGYVDVNCIIDEDGTPWPLEFTMRMGWPTFNIQQALCTGDHAEWLADLCGGRDSRQVSIGPTAVGVILAIPDFPYSQITRKDVTGIPIYGAELGVEKHVHLCSVMAGTAPLDVQGKVVEGPCLLTAGDYVLVATGVSKSVQAARQRAYRTLETIKIPNSPFWRPDIGQRLKRQLPLIQAQGYATGWEF